MKKIRLLLLALGLVLTIISSGQTALTYRFSNPKITWASPNNYFEFDIDIKAGAAGTYFEAGQAILNFDNSVLQTNSLYWTATLGPDFVTPGFYSTVVNITGTAPNKVANIALVTAPAAIQNSPFDNTLFTQLTGAYQNLFHIKVRLLSTTGSAGLSFILSSMVGQQDEITAPSTLSVYSPVSCEAADFTNTYVARIFSPTPGWTQVGGAVNWATAVNTSVWDGAATLPVGALSNASAVRIHSGATLTIPPTGQLTAASIENNTANGLVIQSDATGTGSLILSGGVTGTGTATAQLYMTTGSWHQVSPILTGQTVSAFLTGSSVVATNGGNRGMMNYINSTNTWSSFYTNATAPGTFAAGQGYMMRPDPTSAAVTFSGTIATGSPSVTLSGAGATGWNLIGNPFTSSITLNVPADASNSFLAVNLGSLDLSNVGVYVWNQSLSKYDVINNLSAASYATLGQAFFVKSIANNSAVNFTPGMQVHNAVTLKSGNAYPSIKLIATNDNKIATTDIKFVPGASLGLDPGYDAGILKLGETVSLYTKLVEDNGVQFMLQALPDNDYANLIIPVGIDSKSGGEVVFSSELENLPSDCKVILEDKVNKTFTDLSENDYTTTIDANSSTTDRFFIHTSSQTTGVAAGTMADKLSAYAFRNIEIRVKGNVGKKAVATLYDMQGRAVLVKPLHEGSLNIIPTSDIKTGIYMLYIKDNDKVQSFKIPLNE